MLTLIIGGAGSGKSAFAEALVCRLPGKRLYLATMLPHGAESRARIEKHRAQRAGQGFETLERGLDLAGRQIPAGPMSCWRICPTCWQTRCSRPRAGAWTRCAGDWSI